MAAVPGKPPSRPLEFDRRERVEMRLARNALLARSISATQQRRSASTAKYEYPFFDVIELLVVLSMDALIVVEAENQG
ncbi:hypothetical protein [Paraburkholderia sp. EG304]|uniref:hypothetical protein n=1 Tax=Paraburkholderia sp. EG304 TaxID=3237015 RepID=UPI00397CA66A